MRQRLPVDEVQGACAIQARARPNKTVADRTDSGQKRLSQVEAFEKRVQDIARSNGLHLEHREREVLINFRAGKLRAEAPPEYGRDRDACRCASAEGVAAKPAACGRLRRYPCQPIVRPRVHNEGTFPASKLRLGSAN